MEATLPITAAICTHNRAGYLALALALAGLQRQSLPAKQFEILVIDNRSTDDTRQVVQEFQQHLPNLRYVHEAQLGLSYARNTAMHEARGRYLAYLDDDAIPEPQWLQALLTAFTAQASERVACVGGRIDPIREVPRPDWLPDELLNYLTVVDWGSSGMALTPQRRYVAGANVAFDLAALREVGGFDRTLTRTGGNLISHDEILVERRLAAQGFGVYYEHEAAVRHQRAPAGRAAAPAHLAGALAVALPGTAPAGTGEGLRIPVKSSHWRRSFTRLRRPDRQYP